MLLNFKSLTTESTWNNYIVITHGKYFDHILQLLSNGFDNSS